MKHLLYLFGFIFCLQIGLLAQQKSANQKAVLKIASPSKDSVIYSIDTNNVRSQNRIAYVWGRNLNMRLDSLPPTKQDTFVYNHHTFRIVTGPNYTGTFFPHVINGILVYCDKDGKVQNIVVKEFYYNYNIGTMIKTGYSPNRELYNATNAIQFHVPGDFITVKNIACVDTAGKKMNIVLPPFKIVKVR